MITTENVSIRLNERLKGKTMDILEQLKKLGGSIGKIADTSEVGAGETAGEMAATILDARDEIRNLRAALAWCGGSADFGEGGQAREGWDKTCRPLLQLEDTGGGFVA